MGACASKGMAKEFDPKSAPKEQVSAPFLDKSKPENVPQKTDKGVENQNEAPLIDLTETKEEAKESTPESKPAQAEPVSTDSEVKVPAVENKVEVVAAPATDKVEATTEKSIVIVVPSKEKTQKAEDSTIPSETTTTDEAEVVPAAPLIEKVVVVPEATAEKVVEATADKLETAEMKKEKEITVVAEDKKEEKKQNAIASTSTQEKTDDAPLIVL